MLFLFGWAMTILWGFVNVVFRDTQHILGIVLQILFYLTPIIYPAQSLSSTCIGWVLAFNPFTPLLDVIREPMLEGRPPSLTCFGAAAAITLGVRSGRRPEPRQPATPGHLPPVTAYRKGKDRWRPSSSIRSI